MTLHSSHSSDPYDLERLAEDLAARDLVKAGPSESVRQDEPSGSHDLPIYIPLAHDNPHFIAPVFNVEDFLLSRTYTSLHDLRSELRHYLSSLKEELVKLINDDYEAFISLSTDLRGEGVRLERLKFPLVTLKAQILVSKNELRVIQSAIQEKLQKRATLREEKTLLHLLLKISESVTRLESLLLIAYPVQDIASSPEISGLKIPSHLSGTDDDSQGDKMRGNRAKHLGRIAAEYTQLLYHLSKARVGNCAFVDEVQWRIDRIHSTLSADLDHLFASTLIALADGKSQGKVTEMDKAKWTADLSECLRTYDVLGLWRDAEDVLRREVVRRFVKKTIFPGALATPHSPILPHTPMPTRSYFSASSTASYPPRTPYTPYTAFAAKQNPFDFNYGSTLSSAHLLDDTNDTLARLYNQILRFVERDLSRIMDVAEKVSVKSTSSRVDKFGVSALVLDSTIKQPLNVNREGFELMANVVWAEIGRAIMDELGSIVFAAGRPDEFRKHHETTQAFIRSLEFLAPSIHAIESMRSHPVYSAFDRRWQLSVYFQLRWKEIVSKLEDTLAITRLEHVARVDQASFATVQAEAVWTAMSTCWSAEVYLPALSHRFWRLTLQLLSRYKSWLDSSLPAFDPVPNPLSSANFDKAGLGSPSLSRASTPMPPSESPSAENHVADDAVLRQLAAAIIDINTLRSHTLTMWRDEISIMLPDASDIGDEGNVKPEDALQEAVTSLTSVIPPLSNQVIAILSRRCCDGLLPVRSIPSQFRAMANKRSPTEPSYFVSAILTPVKSFFSIGMGDGPGAALRDDLLKKYAEEVFEAVCQRYIYFLTLMKKTEESLKRLKKGKKSAFSLFGNTSPGKDDESRDEERIRTQMILDVHAFGKDAESLGVDVSCDTFRSLTEMVQTDDATPPNTTT